jgi:hypothetical protein
VEEGMDRLLALLVDWPQRGEVYIESLVASYLYVLLILYGQNDNCINLLC